MGGLYRIQKRKSISNAIEKYVGGKWRVWIIICAIDKEEGDQLADEMLAGLNSRKVEVKAI